jgi:hypothetical protein
MIISVGTGKLTYFLPTFALQPNFKKKIVYYRSIFHILPASATVAER